jgi:hypothetical protein
MNPVRLIVLALVVWLAVLLLRRLLRPTLPKSSSQEQTSQGTRKDYAQMVRCHYCDLHIPKASAYLHDERFYCSEDHFRLEQDRS